ncbi:hypothetical protein [Microbulbifer sp. JTAC008]|uniref:hypothetical protein n=1 Tax=unclassified Microbulbifer TaxID=2619833 RepID=UPI00403996BE
MRNVRLLSVEYILELIIYIILSLIYYKFVSENPFKLEDLMVLAGLWLAIFAYRLVFLQIPLAGIASLYFFSGNCSGAKMMRGVVNAVTFMFIVFIVSVFSPVVSGFLEPERVAIPGAVLISTLLSPLVWFWLKKLIT